VVTAADFFAEAAARAELSWPAVPDWGYSLQELALDSAAKKLPLAATQVPATEAK
jgi:hypothetical protein